MIDLGIFAISMRSAILSILFILSKYSTNALERQQIIDLIYMIGLCIFAISMRSAILSILFILSKYSTDVLPLRV